MITKLLLQIMQEKDIIDDGLLKILQPDTFAEVEKELRKHELPDDANPTMINGLVFTILHEHLCIRKLFLNWISCVLTFTTIQSIVWSRFRAIERIFYTVCDNADESNGVKGNRLAVSPCQKSLATMAKLHELRFELLPHLPGKNPLNNVEILSRTYGKNFPIDLKSHVVLDSISTENPTTVERISRDTEIFCRYRLDIDRDFWLG